ncbi:MAG: alkaline phosphatase family protein [Parvularculaceae bacterium]|nr:alkaline phosphatase family protein [Parvularculaceae bacterium]
MNRRVGLLLCLALLAACASSHAPEREIAVSPESPAGAIRARPMISAPLDESKSLSRIVFGSCAQQNEDQSIWDRIAGENADLVLYFGDNVYGDVRSNDPALPELKAAYMRLADSEPFARVRAAAPVLTVWDDHDYGLNDAGAEYPFKEQSEKLFEYVWNVASDDARAVRPGVYGSWTLGEEGKRVQIIMLDTRYFRSPLKPTDKMNEKGKERYLPDPDPAKTMLGAEQWAWLAGELKKPADLRLLVSSVQVLSEGHGWEAWRLLPTEREKLYALLNGLGAKNLMILSGDRHAAALYRKTVAGGYPLFEATSSSLNLPASVWRAQSGDTYVEKDPNRLGDMYYDANYGRIDIDWARGKAAVSIRDKEGGPVFEETFSFR